MYKESDLKVRTDCRVSRDSPESAAIVIVGDDQQGRIGSRDRSWWAFRAIILANVQRTVVSFGGGHNEESSRARPGVMVVSVMCDNNWMIKDN